MKTTDIVKGIMLNALMLALAMVGGTVDYRDATHFNRPDEAATLRPDTAETAFDVIRCVHLSEQQPKRPCSHE